MREIVNEIVEDVLLGRLESLSQLYERWPENSSDEIYESIYDDTESVLENVRVQKGNEISKELFAKSRDYRFLVIDFKLLGSGLSENKMSKLRKALIDKKNLKLEGISSLIIEEQG